MWIGAASAVGEDFERTLNQAITSAGQTLQGQPPNLAVFFASGDYEESLETGLRRIRELTGVTTLIGCTGEGVIGPEHEHERTPALALWLASMPEAWIHPFHLTQDDVESELSPDRFLLHADTSGALLLMGDPYSLDVDTLLGRLNAQLPGVPVIGGMCSGGFGPGTSALFLDDQVYREGAIGVSLSGALAIETVVSQGCRPIGKTYMITAAEQNVIGQLSGRLPIEVIHELLAEVTDEEHRLMQNGLFVGRVIDEYKTPFQRGDFLIRNIMGVDQEEGTLAVMDRVRPGVTIQFHVRDAATADEDLRCLLAPASTATPAGALLFSCNGRGRRMFTEPDHDVRVVRTLLQAPPVAGFFCAGELGPIGGKNFIHGHTASLALFRPLAAMPHGAHPS